MIKQSIKQKITENERRFLTGILRLTSSSHTVGMGRLGADLSNFKARGNGEMATGQWDKKI